MRQFWIFLLVMTMTSVSASAQMEQTSVQLSAEAQEQASDMPWPLKMQGRLDLMMRDRLVDTSQLGLMVWDLTDDRSVFASNQRQLLRPASTMKVMTAVAALDQLGGNYQLTTSLYYTGNVSGQVLQGDVYCVGGMDPLFSSADIRAFANALRGLGIQRIDGRLIADTSMKDTLRFGEGWCWDDKNPVLSPLLVDRKPDFVGRLRSALSDCGISVRNGAAGEGRVPAGAVLVSQCKHTIDQLLMTMMKDSDNLYAESLFYQLAAAGGRKSAGAKDAIRLEKALIERIGLDASDYRLADGSGLSLYNYLSAELEVRILRYAYQQSAIYAHLRPSLPVAGVDGTLKNRMKGTAAEGNVRAKTGTVSGISSLAGYCTASNGHLLCFAIINQGVMRASAGRQFQDEICQILCQY